MQVLSSLSGIPFYAPSAGFAPTNSADVSAIASSYAESAASGKLDATASSQFLTSVPAGYATTADVESAVSGKQDSLTFGYDTSDKISGINGSALAGEGGGMVTAIGTAIDPWYATSISSINGMKLSAAFANSATNAGSSERSNTANYAQNAGSASYANTVAQSAVSAYISAVDSPSGTIIVTNKTGIDATDSAVIGEYIPGYSGRSTYGGNLIPFNGYGSAIFTGIPDSLPVAVSLDMRYGQSDTIVFSGSNGTTASASYGGTPTALTADLGKVSSVYIYTLNEYIQQSGLSYTADTVDNASIVALAHASALPTYQYDVEDKISSINGSALAVGGGGVDSATCSAIASAYAESAASSKLDTTAASSFATTAYVDSSVSSKLDTTAQVVTSIGVAAGALSSINGYGLSAGLANSASTALYDSAGRPLTSFVTNAALPVYGLDPTDTYITSIDTMPLSAEFDSATCSAIASGYAESAASGKLDSSASSSFYPSDNPSGFISSVDLSDYATTAYVDSSVSSKLDATASSQFLTAVPSDYATTAYVDSSISGFAYESAVSAWTAKQDALTFGYDTADKISSIDGSAIAGGGGGGGLVSAIGSLYGHITSINSSDIVGRPSAVMTRSADENILQADEYMSMGASTSESRWFSDSLGINKLYLRPNHTSNDMSATAYDTYENEVGVVPLTATALTISSDTAVIVGLAAQSDENGLAMYVSGFKFSPSGDYIEALPRMDSCVLKSESVVRLGTATTATGDDYDVKFAQGTASAGYMGFAFGSYASAEYGAAFGSNAIGGYTSLAAGSNVSAYSDSLAVGGEVSATYTSMAQGNYASAFDNSFARGLFVSAINSATVFGQYNLSGDGSGESGAAFVIGDGDEYALHDLMVVTKDGEITMYSSTADTAGTGIMSSLRAISAAATGGVTSLQYKAIPIIATATASGGPLGGNKVSEFVLSLYPDTAIGAPLYTELSSITSFDLQLSGDSDLNAYFGQYSADTVAVMVKPSALDKYQWSIGTSDYQLLGTLRDASGGLLSGNTYTASIQIRTNGFSSNTWADGQTFDDQHPYIAIQNPSGIFRPFAITYASGTAGYYGGNGGTAISGVNEYPLYAQMSYQTQPSYQTAYASASATQATAQDVLYILLPDGV